MQRRPQRRSEWRHTGGIATHPHLRQPTSLVSSVQRLQAERRRAAEAAAEKERVEAYWYCNTSTPQNPHAQLLRCDAVRQSSAKLQRQPQRRSEWRRTGGIAAHPHLRTPAPLASSVQRCQAERRRAAEAAAEKERVEAYWYCNTSTPQNSHAHSFFGASLQAELRKVAEAAAEKERVEAH